MDGAWAKVGFIAGIEEALTLVAVLYVAIDRSIWAGAGLVFGAAIGAALATAFNII